MLKILAPRQVQAFKNHKVAVFSLWILAFLIFVATFADILANNKPLFLRYKGETYFPIIQTLTKLQLMNLLNLSIMNGLITSTLCCTSFSNQDVIT